MTTFPMKLTCTKCGAADEGTLHIEDEPAREWVGLTDEEIWAMDAYTLAITDQETQWLYRLARAVEAKLKEKNRD